MAEFKKFNSFAEAVCKGVHNFDSDTLKVALTNTDPTAVCTKLSELTSAITSGFDTMSLVKVSSGQVGGVYSYVPADLTMTASGAIAAFRYVVIYNDTASNKEVVCYFDRGTSTVLTAGDTLKLNFDSELFTLS